jgi:hypothetical protein
MKIFCIIFIYWIESFKWQYESIIISDGVSYDFIVVKFFEEI